MEGRCAHSTLIDPAVNGGKLGHVFVTLETTEGKGTDLVPGQVNRRVTKTVGKLDWDGKVVGSFGDKAPGGVAVQHLDGAPDSISQSEKAVTPPDVTYRVSGEP